MSCIRCDDPSPPMDFDVYQEEAMRTAKYTDRGDPSGQLMYPLLGLAGETGEVAEKVKKFYRDGGDKDAVRQDIKKELGDVLWYVTAIAREWGLTLKEIAEANIEKLRSRRARGVIGGSGDNR